MFKRIIARLDIKNNTLVKGISLEGLRVLGDPRFFAVKYYEDGIDEIHFQDVVASLYNRNTLDDVISSTVKNVFVTINAGGGIRDASDINRVLRLGADKITINSEAIRNPNLIKIASETYGVSTIAIAIETLKVDNKYMVFIESGREKTNIELFYWIEKIQKLGAGEIILTSIEYEGKKNGFDLSLYKKIKNITNIPIIAHGGAGTPQDIVDVFNITDVDAVSLASILHYSYMKNINFKDEKGSEIYLKNFKSENKNLYNIKDIKNILYENNINIRINE